MRWGMGEEDIFDVSVDVQMWGGVAVEGKEAMEAVYKGLDGREDLHLGELELTGPETRRQEEIAQYSEGSPPL